MGYNIAVQSTVTFPWSPCHLPFCIHDLSVKLDNKIKYIFLDVGTGVPFEHHRSFDYLH